MRLTASLQRGGQTPFQASQTPPLRPRRCSVVTHTGRRDTLLAGLVATGSLLLPLDDASAAAAAPAARKPFCAVVDQVVRACAVLLQCSKCDALSGHMQHNAQCSQLPSISCYGIQAAHHPVLHVALQQALWR